MDKRIYLPSTCSNDKRINIDDEKKISIYLDNILRYILNDMDKSATVHEADFLINQIITILQNRKYNYQSKSKTSMLYLSYVEGIKAYIENNQPIHVFLDLGGGYHASINAVSFTPLSFDVGIAELLLLYQIKCAYNDIFCLYRPAIFFTIVIDNCVAQYSNNVPIEKTIGYITQFRNLIKLLGMENIVDLFVQSEHQNINDFTEAANEYLKKTSDFKVNPTVEMVRNVERFTGSILTTEQCCWCLLRHHAATYISELFINCFIGNNIRFVQQTVVSQMTFRPFPGGASRIQCGLVGFKVSSENIVPTLITIQNDNHIRYNFDIKKYILETSKMLKKNIQCNSIT